jgi:hypothetical protein
MAQKTFVDGDVLTASDLNTYCSGEGGAWTSYSPGLAQTGAVTFTIDYSKYSRYGRTIHWSFWLTVTSAGTGGSAIVLTTPTTAASRFGIQGSGSATDASGSLRYTGLWRGESTTTAILVTHSTTGTGWGNNPNIALASGDVLEGHITYESAS